MFTEPLTLTTLNFHIILKNIYQNHGGLENVFTTNQGDEWIFETITRFKSIFSIDHMKRTTKHISDPAKDQYVKE